MEAPLLGWGAREAENKDAAVRVSRRTSLRSLASAMLSYVTSFTSKNLIPTFGIIFPMHRSNHKGYLRSWVGKNTTHSSEPRAEKRGHKWIFNGQSAISEH